LRHLKFAEPKITRQRDRMMDSNERAGFDENHVGQRDQFDLRGKPRIRRRARLLVG